jgi:C1A family cysteine protease
MQRKSILLLSVLFIIVCASIALAAIGLPTRTIILDSDSDGVADSQDNCPNIANRDQADSDRAPTGLSDRYGDACDNCKYDFNADQKDSDGDRIGDACDNCPTVANRDQANTDDDPVGSACDNCPSKYNPDQADKDADGTGDACEAAPEYTITQMPEITVAEEEPEEPSVDKVKPVQVTNASAPSDKDKDGIFDFMDNCKYVINKDQTDSDGDGYGDACDTCKNVKNYNQFDDADNDEYGDPCDTCPEIYNPDQKDTDKDGVGDACDNCPKVANANQLTDSWDDWDSDGVGNECDNCEDDYNPDQNDSDTKYICTKPSQMSSCKTKSDGHGDVCDSCPTVYNPDQSSGPDQDGDGKWDQCDNCPSVPNYNQLDSDKDGKGDACDACPMDKNDTDNDGIENMCDLCPNDAQNKCNLCTMPVNSYPAYFDWRYMGGKNYMTKVKDQASCGSCYAHAPLGAIEAKYNIEKNTSGDTDLSEQAFVSGCFSGVGSCFGGWHTEVMKHIKTEGVVTETKYPYMSKQCVYDKADPQPGDSDHTVMACYDWCTPQSGNSCSSPTSCNQKNVWANTQIWKITSYTQATNNINAIKKSLVCNGPMSVCSPNWWHCVVLVGWNNNEWIIKNSWGIGWGNGGYWTVPFTGHDYSEIINDAWYVSGVTKS